jgi:penicillin G amidase
MTRAAKTAVVAICGALLLCVALITIAPLPTAEGVVVSGLKHPTTIGFDRYGVPHIRAENREDAFVALGYISARDRLFQMDLLRRKAAGRLAEVFGSDLVESDIFSRRMGFEQLSEMILARLPDAQVAALNAFSVGANQAMRDAWVWPFEFLLLRYQPKLWRPQDSLLVALDLAGLSLTDDQERAASVMRAALPASVVEFLTPESDCYNELLAPRAPERCAGAAIPAAELAELMREAAARPEQSGATGVGEARPMRGSNGWVVSGSMTRDGRAILANDMHLFLETPNSWGQAVLSYGDVRVEGLFFPGLPMIISGSNGHVAWGMTSVEGDFSDLVRVRRDPSAVGRYFDSRHSSTPFLERVERIDVRGDTSTELLVQETEWGPLVEPLLGEGAAIHWTMLDPDATNLNLIEMDQVKTTQEALPLLRSAGTPPLNGLVADSTGSIGWTFMGKIPKRRGFDGVFSEYWDNAAISWDGYLGAAETPYRIDPPNGYLVSANQRMLSRSEFASTLGHDFSGGYRAFEIDRSLAKMHGVSENEMAMLQLDTRADPYRYYQKLAIDALNGATDDAHKKIREAALAWDGKAETDSLGLPMIVEFRKRVIDAILSPLLARCRKIDSDFSYVWTGVDVPIQRLIDSSRVDLVPPPYRDWTSFIREMLDQSAARVSTLSGQSVDRLRWGDANKAEQPHPLSAASPVLAWLLNMPRAPMAGCAQCVRFYHAENGKSSGANARIVVSPGHEEDGLIQMAGGQSGHFISAHYNDQEADWVAGLPHGFRQREIVSCLELRPLRTPEN